MASRIGAKTPTKNGAESPARVKGSAHNVSVSSPKPIVPLLDWQSDYIHDKSRFKGVLAAVQTGKSFGNSLEQALDAQEFPATLEIMLSASERQSCELMEKVKQHTRAWGCKFEDGYFGDTSIAEHRVILPNGSRLIALPANPDTARGYSGNVLLDEFALHRDSQAIWAAMMTRATRGFKVRVASTLKGTLNKFYELVKAAGLHEGICPGSQPVQKNGWSWHWVDIHMAKAQGMPVDIEALRQAIDDDEIWDQDYCNIPVVGADCFIPLEMILACESGEASLDWDGNARPGLSAGWDFARKRDGSVILIGDAPADLVVVRGAKWLDRMTFADQTKIGREVATVIEASGGRFCIDSTGIGAQLGETLSAEFPCVEAVDFSTSVDTGVETEDGKVVREPVKERMAMLTKRRFEDHLFRLPESTRIRRGCQAVKRFIGPTGKVRLDAARTDKGHGDEFWALALLNAALDGPRDYTPASSVGLVGRSTFAGLMQRTF